MRLARPRLKLPPRRRPCLSAAFSTAAAVGSAAPSTDHLLELLRGCVSASHLPLGLRIHARAVVSGAFASYPALQTRLIGMYVLARRFRDAVAVFSSLPRGAAASSLPWNWLIRGFTAAGNHRLAVLFYLKMWSHPAAPLPDGHTLPYVVKSCAALRRCRTRPPRAPNGPGYRAWRRRVRRERAHQDVCRCWPPQ
ncbi:hypothetical protein PR202_ga13687 [Eleusine coracana subsp. coracana]|uniref:Pentatricopeptide repeat-containing protein n=1 Tax=Eleusine coracana subsp. coracana TaxID=191504 RepID=A0AAV5CFM0_ELECO|nr:hypothetical protein PR202_ga13687 [Eleusine coracana subsp. coracana]